MKHTYYLLFIFITSLCFGQESVDFLKYELKGTGYISVPSLFEKQDGAYKSLAERGQQLYGNEVTEDRVVFQLKGKNQSFSDKKPSYEKIIFETHIAELGYYEKINSTRLPSASELIEIGDSYKSEIDNATSLVKIKLLAWDGATNVKIGKLNAVKISYIRQLNYNEPSQIEIYKIQNNDRLHTITFAYRQSSRTKWKPIFNKILDSFTITAIR